MDISIFGERVEMKQEKINELAKIESSRLIRMIQVDIITEDTLPNTFPNYTGLLERRDYESFTRWVRFSDIKI